MTPERASRLVAWWVRRYTRDLPDPVAERRIEEIDADLHDHIAHERAAGTGDRRIAFGIASRMLRGTCRRRRMAQQGAQPILDPQGRFVHEEAHDPGRARDHLRPARPADRDAGHR